MQLRWGQRFGWSGWLGVPTMLPFPSHGSSCCQSTALAAPPCSSSSFPSLEWHKWGETGLAGHSRDPVTPLMRERKQFIAPNKCYSTSIRQPPLLLPLTLNFSFCTTANSDFKLFLLPDSASLWAGVNPGWINWLLQAGVLQVLCFLAKFQDSTTRNVKLYCIFKNNKKPAKQSSTAVLPPRWHKADLLGSGQAQAPGQGWAGLGVPRVGPSCQELPELRQAGYCSSTSLQIK